jgi:xanthosine utilization system XapX-like protein
MLHALQVVTVISVSVAMALALAHALELPGKLRLTKEAYYAMQSIYYPGFTIGGIGEAGGLLLSIILLLLTPMGSADFSLTLVGLLGLIGMQAVYWIFTHPVNRFWLRGEKLGSFGSGFFSIGAKRSSSQNETRQADWMELRNRWEYSHVARAVLAMLSLICLVITLSC